MTRSAVHLLQDILESIRQIEEYTAGLTRERFSVERIVQDAVVRRLEIIGEAVKGLPEELRDRGHSSEESPATRGYAHPSTRRQPSASGR